VCRLSVCVSLTSPPGLVSKFALHHFPSRIHLVSIFLISVNNGYNHWTGLLDRTTGLTQTAKYNSFSAEQKLNFLVSSVTLLTLLSVASFLEFLEVKGHMHI